MAERWQRPLLMIFVLYITFLGGTAYPDLVIVHRIVLQVAMSAVLGGWMLLMILKGKAWPKTPFDAALLAYALWLGISSAFSQDTRVSLEAIWILLVHIALFYWLVALMQAGRQRWIFEALFIAGGVVVMVSALEFASWYFGLKFAGFEQGWFEIGGLADPMPPFIRRVALAFNISTILANYVATMLPLILGWALSVQQKDYRQGLFILFGGVAAVLILTVSRGGWMGAVIGIGLFIALQLRRSPRFASWLRPKIFVPLVVGGLLAFSAFLVIFSIRSDRSSGDAGRVDMWQSAVEMLQDHPITGVGVREFGVAFRALRDPEIAQNKLMAAHNLSLNTGAEIGLVGVAILLWLTVIFLRQWLAAWQGTSVGRKVRLEAILAALVTFAIHSLVDTFALTANVLPILIMVAYVAAGQYSPESPAPVIEKTAWRRGMAAAALAVVVVYGGWFVQLDRAYFELFYSMQAIGNEDLEKALEHAEQAEALDPHLGLYPLHRAYVLGLLADENPERYLSAAIEAGETTMKDNPTFDYGHANLAALYFAEGRYLDAAAHLKRAIEIYPETGEFHLFYAQSLEMAALSSGNDAASPEIIAAYHAALDADIELARSDFWMAGVRYVGRVTALVQYLDVGKKGRALFVAVCQGWETEAARLLEELDHEEPFMEAYAQALYYWKLQGDYTSALQWYDEALVYLNPELAAPLYAEQAEIYWTLGDAEAAEREAKTALFIDSASGGRAYYILALIRLAEETVPLDDELFNEQLIMAVPPHITLQHYAGVVYARPATFDFLPQLPIPGEAREVYAPWLLLAERYAGDDNPNTDPQAIYTAIAKRSPYLEMMTIR